MNHTIPKPATPLPWHYGMTLVTADCDYVIRAANAFPHLVAALEEIAKGDTEATKLSLRALAIARGEITP